MAMAGAMEVFGAISNEKACVFWPLEWSDHRNRRLWAIGSRGWNKDVDWLDLFPMFETWRTNQATEP